MNNNIINKYKLIIFKIINIVDPFNKPIGRPIKYNYDICLEYIFKILKTGLSWSNLNNIIDNKSDAIRKRFNKWCKLGIFINAHNILLKIYKNKYDITNMYIDSTVIKNLNGSLHSGYNIKIKNKKSIKISAIVDNYKIPHVLMVTSSNPHDAKIMENIILENYFNYKNINLVGDKGYIKSNNYKNTIKEKYNINLITPNRINSKNTLVSDLEKSLLNKRHVVENFFSLLKRSFLRINFINDKTLINYNNFLSMAASFIILTRI